MQILRFLNTVNMKRFLYFSILLFFFFTTTAQNNESDIYLFSYFKGNGEDGLHLAYSADGLNWKALKNDSSFLKPTVSKDKLMRDPCIVRGADGRFHMVWTVSWNDKGIGYASSVDLVHWTEQSFVPVMKHEDSVLNCWAPEITYDRRKKEYMIYWASTIPGRFMEGDTSGDARYNHRLYYTTTRDFMSFSPTRMLYNQGFNVIDATIVAHKSEFIMFLKDETKKPPQKNIRIATSKRLTGGYGKPSESITGNYWAEGPTVIKIGKKWIVYFDKYTQHQYGAIESTDLKNWKDISDQLKMPEGIRHGTVFAISRKEFESFFK